MFGAVQGCCPCRRPNLGPSCFVLDCFFSFATSPLRGRVCAEFLVYPGGACSTFATLHATKLLLKVGRASRRGHLQDVHLEDVVVAGGIVNSNVMCPFGPFLQLGPADSTILHSEARTLLLLEEFVCVCVLLGGYPFSAVLRRNQRNTTISGGRLVADPSAFEVPARSSTATPKAEWSPHSSAQR